MEKIFTIYAGVNGSGKSTLYRSLEGEQETPRINTDEVVEKIGSWKNPADQIKASKIAIKLRKEYLENNVSFNQETTLTGKSILKFIDTAIEKGYKIEMFYVGLESPELAIERVKERTKRGGHFIPEETVRKRYFESLENIVKIVNKCDYLEVSDNTNYFNSCIYKENKKVTLLPNIPDWMIPIVNALEKLKSKK